LTTFRNLAVALAAGLLISTAASQASAQSVPTYVTAAIADPQRPPKALALDAARKPAELLTLIGLKPGDKILDFIPGPYWDRLFSDVVGQTGHVYLYYPVEYDPSVKIPADTSALLPGVTNASILSGPVNAFAAPETVDIVWMRQNYHDLYDKFMGPADVPAVNKAIYKALKPGGLYVIIDHSAKLGTGLATTDTLHRIDPAVVKTDLAAAGFVFAGESNVLRNPADPLDQVSYEPPIAGKTDQFAYVFRKP
jgi:predicted methyltransferase